MNHVRVFMNGEAIFVPERVNSYAALRQARHVAGDDGVAVKSMVEINDVFDPATKEILDLCDGWCVLGFTAEDVPGEVVRCWEFTPDGEYKSITASDLGGWINAIDEVLGEIFDDEPRAPWESDPEGWKHG